MLIVLWLGPPCGIFGSPKFDFRFLKLTIREDKKTWVDIWDPGTKGENDRHRYERILLKICIFQLYNYFTIADIDAIMMHILCVEVKNCIYNIDIIIHPYLK